MTWAEICDDKLLATLPHKIESDRWGNIIMSPPPRFRHVEYQNEIAHLLRTRLSAGKAYMECPVQTSEGVKVVDVVWMSDQRRRSKPSDPMLLVAPEVCIEVESPSNSSEEMMERKRLYFEKGAEEFWLCDQLGQMSFFDHAGRIPQSLHCAGFPLRVELD